MKNHLNLSVCPDIRDIAQKQASNMGISISTYFEMLIREKEGKIKFLYGKDTIKPISISNCVID